MLDTKRREFIALVGGGGLLLAANVRRYILSSTLSRQRCKLTAIERHAKAFEFPILT
jgi:hypothetical protein